MKIMLDAGHFGSTNQSPALAEYYESKQMWRLCEYLASALAAYGFEVLKTRSEPETDLAVTKRGKMASDCGLFISLHSNAVGNFASDTDRVEVYAPFDGINDSHKLAQILAEAVADCMAVSEGRVKTRKSGKGDYEYYGVLRGARSVGCPLYYIIEHSFHTNEKSARWLMEDENLRRIAEIEAACIAAYFATASGFDPGDVNMNGRLDIYDAILIKRLIMNTVELTDGQKVLADINADGKTDIFDYITAKRRIMS